MRLRRDSGINPRLSLNFQLFSNVGSGDPDLWSTLLVREAQMLSHGPAKLGESLAGHAVRGATDRQFDITFQIRGDELFQVAASEDGSAPCPGGTGAGGPGSPRCAVVIFAMASTTYSR